MNPETSERTPAPKPKGPVGASFSGDLFGELDAMLTAGDALRAAYVASIGTQRSGRVMDWDAASQRARNRRAWRRGEGTTFDTKLPTADDEVRWLKMRIGELRMALGEISAEAHARGYQRIYQMASAAFSSPNH